MEHSTISTKSLHYRLATYYGPLEWYDLQKGTDFCSYFWAVVKGIFWVSMIIGVGGVVSVGFGDFLGWLAAGIVHGFVQLEQDGKAFVFIFCGIFVFIGTLVGWLMLADKLNAWKRARLEKKVNDPEYWNRPEQKGFIATAYTTFKDKYCIRIRTEPTKSED